MKTDILKALDKRKAVFILLDLSTAFDTVDHDIMLRRRGRLLGLRGKPLASFCSYLNAVWLCLVMFGGVWWCLVVFGGVWWCLVEFGGVW